MDAECQANIKNIADDDNADTNQLMVVLGAGDLEGAEISAETVTVGDPSFAGPLAGVSLRLPVYHILEPDIMNVVPKEVYEEAVGIWKFAADVEEIGKRFKAIREKITLSRT